MNDKGVTNHFLLGFKVSCIRHNSCFTYYGQDLLAIGPGGEPTTIVLLNVHGITATLNDPSHNPYQKALSVVDGD